MSRASFPDDIVGAVDLADLFVTVNPAMPLPAAVDVICDDRHSRAVRRLLEHRLAEQGILRRAA